LISTLIAPPRSTKRTITDAQLEELSRMLGEESGITSQLNDIDHDLELLDLEHDRRIRISAERKTKRE
jgi:hypothetical protein